MSLFFNPGRLAALVRKESLQVVRDPSAILIAFVLPVVLLFLFSFAVSLDVQDVRLGLVVESDAPQARELAAAFAATRYFEITPARDRREVDDLLVAGKIRGFAVIPQGSPDVDAGRHLRDSARRIAALFRSPQRRHRFLHAPRHGLFRRPLAGLLAGVDDVDRRLSGTGVGPGSLDLGGAFFFSVTALNTRKSLDS